MPRCAATARWSLGGGAYGGDSSAVAAQLDGTVDVTQIFSTGSAFAALRSDGSVVTWGHSSAGGDSSAVAAQLDGTVDVTQIFSTSTAFAALRSDGSVVTWGKGGYENYGGDSSTVAATLDGTVDVTQIFSTDRAFAALRSDGSVVTWGYNSSYDIDHEGDYGSNSYAVAAQIDGTVDVTQIFSTGSAFAALRSDGSVVTWGYGDYFNNYGGDSSAVVAQIDGTVDVTQIFSTDYAFAALRSDGSVVTWGGAGLGDDGVAYNYGGDSSAVAAQIDGTDDTLDVTQIFSIYDAFAALRSDGSVVTWGSSDGYSSTVAAQLDGTVDVTQIFSTDGAFAALRSDGSVVTWGYYDKGGDSSAVAAQLDGTVDVTQIFSTGFAFAALRSDGSVVTWGSYGGNSSAVASQLSSGVVWGATIDTDDVYTFVNHAPAGTDIAVTAQEDSAYTFGTADFGFTDPADSPSNALLAVKITSLPAAGALTLNGAAVTAGQAVTATEIAAGRLQFAAAAHGNGTDYAHFSFQVQDNAGTAHGGVDLDPTANTLTLNVAGINDAPAGTDQAATLLENGSYTLAATDFGFTDPNDNPANALQAVKIAALPSAGTLKLNGTAVIAGQYVSAVNIAAGKLVYTPAANASGTAYATLKFQVQDNGGSAKTNIDLDPTANTLTFNVTPTNDAPAGTDKTVTLLEEGSHALAAADFGFTDPNNSPANSLLAVKIASLPAVGTLKLNGSAVSAGQSVSLADLNANKLVFAPAANANGLAYATVTFQVQDDGGTANGGVDLDPTANTVTFNVTGVNDAPAGTDKTVSLNEDGNVALAAANFGFSDTEGNSLQAVKIASLPSAGTLKLNGSTVTVGQSVSVADVAAGKLVFAPVANANSTGYANFKFQVQDNGGTANGGVDLDATANTLTFNVTAVNDAPAGADKAVSLNAVGVYSFAASDFGFTDPNDNPANTLLAIKITTLPSAGSLKLNGVAVTAGQTVTAVDIAAGLLKFTPAANASGANYATVSFQVKDNGGTANGGVDLDPTANKITVNINADFTAPTATAFSPADGSANALNSSNVTVTFSEAIARGVGSIVLKDAAGTVVETFDAASSNRLSLAGSTLTLDPSKLLDNATQYFVTFPAGSVKDLAGNSYAGIASYDFTTKENRISGTVGDDDGLIGTALKDSLVGLAGDDTLLGLAGNDTLDGGTGDDILVGGKGDDVYVVNSTADVVAEQANQGTDWVRSSVAYTLSANVENLTLTGSGSLSGTGNGLGNTLVGNAGINSLEGSGGNDALTGSAGKDTLTGGLGADVFKYNAAADSGITTALRDSISDFSTAQGDKIDLSALDANAAVLGDQAFSVFSQGAAFAGSFAAQASLFFDLTAHVLYGNNDADTAADFSIGLVGVGSLAATDFVL